MVWGYTLYHIFPSMAIAKDVIAEDNKDNKDCGSWIDHSSHHGTYKASLVTHSKRLDIGVISDVTTNYAALSTPCHWLITKGAVCTGESMDVDKSKLSPRSTTAESIDVDKSKLSPSGTTTESIDEVGDWIGRVTTLVSRQGPHRLQWLF